MAEYREIEIGAPIHTTKWNGDVQNGEVVGKQAPDYHREGRVMVQFLEDRPDTATWCDVSTVSLGHKPISKRR